MSILLLTSIILIHMTGHFSLYENNTGANTVGLLQALSTFTTCFPKSRRNFPSAILYVLVCGSQQSSQTMNKILTSLNWEELGYFSDPLATLNQEGLNVAFRSFKDHLQPKCMLFFSLILLNVVAPL